uniref:Putative secreted peptide n=1 Tax=Rhipicephalus pulchellus TaxID=72859 RepID=L7MA19_RHIPC
MLSLMVFIIGHCRYSSFLTIWLLGVAFGVSGEVLLGVPGHMMGRGVGGSTTCFQPHDFYFVCCWNLPSWYPNAVNVKQLHRTAVSC